MRRLAGIGLLAVLAVGCAARITVYSGDTVDPQSRVRLAPGTLLAGVVDPEAGSAALHRDRSHPVATSP